jgi:hypothetical protein
MQGTLIPPAVAHTSRERGLAVSDAAFSVDGQISVIVAVATRQVPCAFVARGSSTVLAVYMSGTALRVAKDDIDRALDIFNNRFPNPADYGLWGFTRGAGRGARPDSAVPGAGVAALDAVPQGDRPAVC